MEFAEEFKAQSIFRLEENTPRVAACLAHLNEDEVWMRPNDVSNSVGNLILHLCGNIRQYAISSLGGADDKRVRDVEFTTEGGYSKAELLVLLTTTVADATAVVKNTGTDELLRQRNVQGFLLSGIGIIIHITEHYSYHTGQIAFWVKQLKSKNLGFYAGINLNTKND